MPSDSYYEKMYEAEDNANEERKRKLIERLNKMTLEEKVQFLINEYVCNQK